MLEFADQPYRYFPPKPRPLIAALLKQYNRFIHLPRARNVHQVEVRGIERLQSVRNPGDQLLLVSNHPSHSDAQVLVEAARQANIHVRMMAAYDIFLRSRLNAWVMQTFGCFSVDREGSDHNAMREATAALLRGADALGIFPEGNVYLENDRVTPFHEGAMFIALRAAKQLRKGEHKASRICIVPMSMKLTLIEDVRPTLTQQMEDAAAMIDCPMSAEQTPLEMLRCIGIAALHRNLRHRGIDQPQEDDLRTLIETAAGDVLDDLERKLDIENLKNESMSLTDRVRRARRVIHEVRVDPQRQVDHRAATTWADQAMLAFRIISYSGGYVQEKPSIDRIAETLEKLREDLLDRLMEPIGKRKAIVQYHAPIEIDGYLDQSFRDSVRALTAECERQVQAGLDDINGSLDTIGTSLWDQPVKWPGDDSTNTKTNLPVS